MTIFIFIFSSKYYPSEALCVYKALWFQASVCRSAEHTNKSETNNDAYEGIIVAKVFSTCNCRFCMRSTLKSEMCNSKFEVVNICSTVNTE